MDAKAIGERVRQQRKIKGLTQEQLAKTANLSVMSVRRYESGERLATEDALRSMTPALGVSVDYLLGWATEKVIIPERLKIIEINDPTAKDVRYEIEATDQEAYDIGLKMFEDAGAPVENLTPEARIAAALAKLNRSGQQKAVERVEELTEVSKYQNPTPEE